MDPGISALNVSPNKKEELQWIEDNVKDVSLFKVTYCDNTTSFASENYFSRNWKLISIWAFFFAPFMYFFNGVWRKALSVIGLSVLISFIATIPEVLFEFEFSDPTNLVISFIVPSIVIWQYKWDSYRHLVKKETFWW